MKIERTKLRSGTSDVPTECQLLIDRLKSCSKKELMHELMSIDSWVYGKCELYHWIDVLNIFDEILEEAASVASVKFWELSCDVNPNKEDKELLLWVLHFTTLLIEHSFSRHLYNSMEHLITLLSSCDMNVVLGVLNLLYAFSKRSNFLSRLNSVKRSTLICRLTHLAESWGGKENGFGLAECCQDLPMLSFPTGATTLHFEYSSDAPSCQATGTKNKNSLNQITCIHLERVDLIKSSPAEIVKDLITLHNVPLDRQMSLFTNVRLAHCFSDYKKRLLCVRARLQALSILVYSNALQTNAHSLLYSGLLEELVEVLELPYPHLVEIRAAALRTLTSITHFDRNPQYPRLNTIIDVTGASSYHGFLPVLVRNCITSLTSHYTWQNTNVFPLPLATSILSFLYHLSSYEAGGEALVNCGMMECLLRVIDWPGKETEHVTFVTRAVRVIDLITNIDMQAFQTHGGLTSFINRLEMEVEICRKEQPFEIKPPNSSVGDDYDVSVHLDENALPQGEVVNGMNDTQSSDVIIIHDSDSMDVVEVPPDAVPNAVAVSPGKIPLPDYSAAKTGKTCLPQRAALLKSMLNFLKKAIQDSSMTDSIRHVMGESLPSSLKHIISNAEYYGASLFLLATDIVTVFVFQEPSLLSSLQDNGLTDVVLHALLVKDVPATREVLGSLPNVFSALCLNARGLASFVQCQPFERLFKVLLSPVYLSSMRRRRNSDPNGDTASNLGNAMDELMRHQPSLKVDATAAIIKLLEELCALGRDPKYVCWRPQNKTEFSPVVTRGGNGSNRGNEGGGGSSDEEDEEEEDPSAASATPREDNCEHHPNEKIPIPLIDYILNVMKFVDAILSNNSTDDHCLEFVAQGGLTPLISILGLPNLPSDHPTTALAMAVSAPIKSILNLAHEREVLREGLKQLNEILKILEPLHQKCDPPRSALLHELAEAPDLETAFVTPSSTPLLHAVAAAHGYIVMFMLLSRTGEIEIRSLTVHYWGSELGVATLKGLSDLYTSLVWESTLLLSLINGDTIPSGFDFCKEDLDKVKPPEFRGTGEGTPWGLSESGSSNVNCMAMDSEAGLGMEFESDSRASGKPKSGKSYALAQQIKYIKPLLSASSRLGRVLAELLGLMVKVCYGQFSTGSPLRQRRGQQLLFQMASSSHQAKIIADTLTDLLRRSISWSELPPSPLPKFRLTFLVCTLGFTSPILFDEKKYPYHAMLQRFVSLGGLSAYFDIYHWALTAGGKYSISESIEVTDLPDGTGEFIDSWLMLLEKFVNARLIFDTPNYHAKSDVSSNQLSFPLRFLIHIHKLGFAALSSLWGKKPLPKYGARIIESVLSIYRHIIKGEKFIQDKLAKRKECISIGEGTSKRGREEGEAEVNLNHVQQLMDMGFKREHCVEALLHTSGLEQATDYLLTNPPPSRSSQIQSMDLDMSEDDQVQRAIAMSLGEDTAPSVDKKKDFFLERDIFDDIPLEKEALDYFTSSAFEVCLNIADDIPDTVYRISELLGTIIKRNGSNYLDGILNVLKEQLLHSLNCLIRAAVEENPSSLARTVQSSLIAVKVGTRCHLFTLLMEEMRVQCSAVAQKAQFLSRLVQFLVVGHSHIDSNPPRWLSSVLLLIDLLLRISVYSDRKNKMHKITSRTWKWYDLGSGRWARYTPSIDKIINDAYFGGESSVRIVVNRRKYTIQFGSMLQVNDETGNRRPVMMSLKQDRTLFSKYEQMMNDGRKQEDNSENVDDSLYDLEESKRNIVITGLSHSESEHLTRVCVELLKKVRDCDTVNALLRICLRLTRDYELASLFAEMGGVKILLNLQMESMFTGALNVITLLIRHVIEEPRLLIIAIEKVLRSRTLPNIPPCYKELIYMMRMCSSAVCREPDTFVEVAKSILRVDTSILSRKNLGHFDERLLVKSLPPKTYQPDSYMDEISKKAIADLLDALIVHVPDDEPMVIDSPATQATPPPGYIQVDNCGAFGRNSANNALSMLDSNPEISPVKYSVKRKIPDDPTEMTDEEKKKPLLPKSSILKIISDIVRSYPPCSKQVTRHRFQEGQSDLVPESYSALGFIIDKLLPVDAESDDKECSTMARMVLSSIASCNQCIEGQVTIVQEIRCALQRALSLPETPDKHAHIQLLCGLMSTLIENCPPAPPNTPISFKFCPFSNVSHMVRIMQRKGLVTDLARIPSHLDLSSPNMAPTMNAVLKPLETLTRLLSQPPANTGKPKPKPVESMAEDPLGPQSGTTTSDNTRANREETMEDAENTENDISVTGESLEQHSGYQATPQGMEEGDEEIMERPLIRDTSEVEIGDTRERVRVEGRSISRLAVSVPAADAPARTSMEFAGDDTQDDDSEHSREEEEEDDEEEDEDEEDDDDEDEEDEEKEEDISPLRDTSEVEIGDTRERVRVEGRSISRVDVAVSTSDAPARTSMEFAGDDTQDDDPADSGDTDSEHSREVEDEDDEEDDDEEDEEEVEEEEDEEVEEDNNDDDDDAGSAYGDVMETMEPDGFFRIPGLEREREDILMIQYSDPDDIVVNQGSTPGHDFARRNMNDTSLTSRESQRGIGARRYQYLRMAARNTNPPPPVILQRLLGPSAHDLPMSTGQAFIPGYRDTRVVVMDNGLGIFTNPEEEQIDFVDQSGYLFGPSLAATLNNIPTSLHWWNEESKLLDGESAADCVTIVYSSLEAFLDHQRNIELMENKTVTDRKEKLARETMGIETPTKKDESPKADNAEEVTVIPRTSTPRENPDVISVESNESQAEITFENLVDRDLDLRSLVENNEFQTNEMVAHALDLPSPIPTIITTGRSIPEAETVDANASETDVPCIRDNSVNQSRRSSMGSVASARVRSSRRAACSGSDASRRGTHTSGPSSRRLRSRDIPAPTVAHIESQDQPRPSELESEDSDIVYLGTFRDTSASQTIGTPSASQYSVIMPISAQRTDHNAIGAQGTVAFGCARDASNASVNHLYFPARQGADEAIESAVSVGVGEVHAISSFTDNSTFPIYFPSTQDNEVEIIEPSELSSSELSHPVQLTPQQTACRGRNLNHSGHRSHSLSPDIHTFGIAHNSSGSHHEPATYSGMPVMNDSVVDLRPVILNVMSVTENNQMGVADLANDWSRFQLQADDDSMVLTDTEQQVSTSTTRIGPSNSASETERTVSETQRVLTRYVQADHDYGVDSLPVESLLGTVSEDGGSDGNSLNMPMVRSGLVGNVILPEGVDPSFLAALPEEMREEVVAEQVRLQQMRQRAQTQAATDESIAEVPVAEVNPDFLAALPPNIQEEVLAQQRVEQQRQAAAAANPDEPVDAVAFFQNLPPTLRTQILSDMEESQISALSPELAAEAADLRRQLESRNRQLMQERFFSHVNHNNSALSSILRNTGRVGTRYAIHTVPQQQWRSWASRGETVIPAPSATSGLTASGAMVGPCYHHCTRNRFLLDQETMTCLLVLLFVDEPRLNSGRLHRVVRNLCFNPTTREWILKTLLSVFDRCGHGKLCPVDGASSEYNTKNKRQSSRLLQQAQNLEHSGCCTPRSADVRTMVPTWLNIGVDAALGCRANIFSVQRPTGKRGIDKLGAASAAAATLTIHPLAAPTVCKHTLELLISLAKLFPSYYLPMKTHEIESMPKDLSTKDNERFKQKLQAVYAGNGGGLKSKVGPTNFWELLVKLDMMSASKKGKNNCRSYYTLTPPMEFDYFNLCFETSAFGHLVAMFSYPVIRCSTMLTDKLLRLLSLISLGLPDSSPQARKRDRDVMETAEDTDEKREYNQRMKVSEEYIKLAIEVLTSKSCSEEGLEDATSLLLNWSYGPPPTRDMILRLLLDGAQELGNVVCRQISTLLKELRMLKRKSRREKNRPVSNEETAHDRQPAKGVLHDRFTKSTVVVTAPTKVKHGSDLQIPAMIPLTSKTSSQIFFLRTLKVIIQLREAIQLSIKKNKRKGTQEAADLETRPAVGTEDLNVTSIVNGNEGSMASEQQRPMHVDSVEGSPLQSVLPAQRAVRQRECVATQVLRSPRETTSLEERVHQRSEVTNSGPVSEIQHGSSSQHPANETNSSTATFATQAGSGVVVLPNLSEQLCLDELWKVLTDCLLELQDTPDHHAVLVLQPAVEAFFLIHASSGEEKEQKSTEEPRSTPECRVSATVQVQHELAPVSPLPAEGDAPPVLNFLWESPPPTTALSNDTVKFLKFAETHRTVLNQILRQSTSPLSEGPFAVLVDHTRILDFDVKRKYFRAELERLDDGMRREELAIHVRRSCVFEDSFRELHRRRADDWKNRFYIVFEGEEGQDAGGLLREWYVIISRDIFNPNYALFTSSFGDRATYTINPASHYNPHHLCYFKFVGRTIAKAINDNKLLECYFTRSFYKHILGIPLKYTDMESEDYSFYQGLKYLMENHVNTLGEITFSTEVQEFGVTEVRDLIPNGRNIVVSEANKMDYVRLVCQMKMTGAIMKQLGAFLEGFYDIIPKKLISIFNEQELELLISGLPNIDIDELRANTEYHKYQASSLQIKWFWRALRSFEQADRAKFLQFVTGTSKVPLQGFAALEGMNGIQKFQIHRDERSTDRLPSAHTCFNQLDLPVYETYDKLRRYLLKAIQECSEGFGFA